MGLGAICSRANQNNERIYLSGQGADEIISDYGFNGNKIYNQLSTVFVSDTSIICPQRNIDIFFDGTIYGKGSSSIVKKGFIRDKPYAVKIYKPI